jgi:hypothetical protein
METASRFAIAFVLNAAWQVPLVALAAAAGGRLLPSAAARHRLFLAALAASVVLPVVGSVASSGARPAAEAGAASAPPGHAEGAVPGASRLGRAPSRSLAPSPQVANGVGPPISRASSWRPRVGGARGAVRRSCAAPFSPPRCRRPCAWKRSAVAKVSISLAAMLRCGCRRPWARR